MTRTSTAKAGGSFARAGERVGFGSGRCEVSSASGWTHILFVPNELVCSARLRHEIKKALSPAEPSNANHDRTDWLNQAERRVR
jgi:hypothetical protein